MWGGGDQRQQITGDSVVVRLKNTDRRPPGRVVGLGQPELDLLPAGQSNALRRKLGFYKPVFRHMLDNTLSITGDVQRVVEVNDGASSHF